MSRFSELLRGNRNHRFTWTGQVVGEVGDHVNNVPESALALANTGSGLVVAGILIARTICAVLAGPVIGAWSGGFSSSTAVFWAWPNWTGRLPEPALSGVDPDDVDVHDDLTV
ncbi:MAG TPA: hypothetical protein VMT15_00920 [Bryobacteraceae bacterium]|nr:hypothetical protein [Bryobacteraceae bacterium]